MSSASHHSDSVTFNLGQLVDLAVGSAIGFAALGFSDAFFLSTLRIFLGVKMTGFEVHLTALSFVPSSSAWQSREGSLMSFSEVQVVLREY